MSDSLLDRTVLVIEAVVAANEPVGPRALARRTGVDRSAVGRILQHLVTLEMLVTKDGTYSPGPRLFMLGRVLSALDTLPTAAAAALATLVEAFDETSYVCMLRGRAAVFLYEHQSSKPLRYVVELGRPVPLYAGAAGRAILAGLSEQAAIDVMGDDPLTPLTEHTITNLPDLMARRASDREVGISISEGERVEGGAAIAAPIFDSAGLCQGSVVLTCPLSRFENYDRVAIGEAVRTAATTLSARLGAPAEAIARP